MQIINKIDDLITKLNNLKPELIDDSSANKKKFDKLLQSVFETSYNEAEQKDSSNANSDLAGTRNIPNWVDPDSFFDPENPRKPHLGELMEAVTGKTLENLYADPNSNWQKTYSEAADLLNGVLGGREDVRDWSSIMASDDILKAAREQTGAMYQPAIDIVSYFDENNILKEQTAVLKDKKGNILRALSSNIYAAEKTLNNLGATNTSIPKGLEEQVNPNIFDKDLLSFLKQYDSKSVSLEKEVIQSSIEAISSKMLGDTTLDEISKL